LYLANSISEVIHKDSRISVDDIWSISSVGVRLTLDEIFITINIFIDESITMVMIICQYFVVIIGRRSILKIIKQISNICLM